MVIVVDPRLSETARMADLHIMPALGTDSLLLRALIALILEKGWQDQAYINQYTRDWARVLPWFVGFDIDAALEVCQISREQAEKFARILTTKKWGMHRDLGLFFGRHSTVSSYLAILLAIVCGRALVKGGSVMPERVLCLDNSDENDPKVWRTPVTNRFPVVGIYPEGVFPDEVLGDNEDRIRLAFSVLTNPARSYPDSQKMEEALKKLELFVAVDCVKTETTMLADYVLPSMSAYEANGDFDMFTLNYPEVVFGSRKRILEPFGEAKEDSLIFAELTQAMGSAGRAMNWAVLLTSPVYKVALPTVQADTKLHPVLSGLPVFRDWCLLDAAFDLVDHHPEGVVIGMSDTEHMMEKHITHKDGKMHLWCREVEDYLYKYITPEAERENVSLKDGNNMILSSGRRDEAGVNNAMRNPATSRFRQMYTLWINPEDAERMGIADGETVRLSTNRGSIEIPAEYTWRAAHGYCLMPHYFGLHYQGQMRGMHANYLTDHRDLDPLTGNSHWRHTPCRVEKLQEG